jgi:hypothetical protein
VRGYCELLEARLGRAELLEGATTASTVSYWRDISFHDAATMSCWRAW